MNKITTSLIALLALFLFTAGHCERVPDPEIPDDTEDCEAAGAKLLELGCEEATLPDGTTFQAYCEDVQEKGHAVNPSCLKTISSCEEIDTKCDQ